MKRLVCCAIVLAGLVGCSGGDPAPQPATTSSVPQASPMESWVDLMCVTELQDAPDPSLHQPPVITADGLPAAKRRLGQWADAVGAAATTMVSELDEVGPPPEGGEDLTAAFTKYRKRYADLVDTAETSSAFIEASPNKEGLDTASQVLQLQLLAATTPLDSEPAFIPLVEESLFCR